MNRTLVIAISILLAFCAGIYFWTEWQKKEFDASLPEPPAVEEQQAADDVADDVTDDTAGGHWHGDEWHAEPHEVQNEGNTSNGDEWLTIGDPSTGVTITSDVDISELLTESEIEELNQTLEREGFHPEKLSQRQLDYLSVVGINVDMLPPKQRQQFKAELDIQFFGQWGLKPPPEGYSFNFSDLDKGTLILDENGMPILSESQTGRDVPWAEVSAHFEGDPYVEK